MWDLRSVEDTKQVSYLAPPWNPWVDRHRCNKIVAIGTNQTQILFPTWSRDCFLLELDPIPVSLKVSDTCRQVGEGLS